MTAATPEHDLPSEFDGRRRRVALACTLVNGALVRYEKRHTVARRVLDLGTAARRLGPGPMAAVGREFRRAGLAGRMCRRARLLKARGNVCLRGHPEAMEYAALRLLMVRHGDRARLADRRQALLAVWDQGRADEPWVSGEACPVWATLSGYLTLWRERVQGVAARAFWRDADRAGLDRADVAGALADPEFAGAEYDSARVWLRDARLSGLPPEPRRDRASLFDLLRDADAPAEPIPDAPATAEPPEPVPVAPPDAAPVTTDRAASGSAVPAPPANRGRKRPAQGKGKNIGAKMLKMLADDPERYGWTARMWAEALGCRESTVAGTKAWKNVMAVRASRMADRAAGRGRR